MMSEGIKNGRFWILLLCMLSGLTVGYFLGSLCSQVKALEWVNYTGSFGLDQPFQVDLGVLWFSIQIKFKITLAAIIGLICGIFLYKKL